MDAETQNMQGFQEQLDKQSVQEILDKPWDVCNPGDTVHTKRVTTFLLFLEQADSRLFSLEMDHIQIRIRLIGPNANEIVFRANREYWTGTYPISTASAKKLVAALMIHPKSFKHEWRRRLAAQVAMFLGLDADSP